MSESATRSARPSYTIGARLVRTIAVILHILPTCIGRTTLPAIFRITIRVILRRSVRGFLLTIHAITMALKFIIHAHNASKRRGCAYFARTPQPYGRQYCNKDNTSHPFHCDKVAPHCQSHSLVSSGHENGKIKCDTMRAQKKVLSRRRDGIINSPKPKIHSLHEKHQRQD